ncbi:RmlC-like cupin domain-containing protein [Mycena polygramma]|nr:RmlC-like cupin domain-containing protein [Mycena polygramma]
MLFSSRMLLTVLASVISVYALPTSSSPAPVPIISNGPAIASGLKTQASAVDRLSKLLTDANGTLLTGEALRNRTVFNFNQYNQPTGGKGGSLLLAVPCGLNIPHMHPRASELLTVVEGVLDTGFVQENGFDTVVETQLGKYQATVFPMGSMHYQQNPTCSPAVFVAGLGNEDPGRSDIATSFWMLPSDIVDAALGFPETIGGDTIDAWRDHLPANLAAGVDSCSKACGLTE